MFLLRWQRLLVMLLSLFQCLSLFSPFLSFFLLSFVALLDESADRLLENQRCVVHVRVRTDQKLYYPYVIDAFSRKWVTRKKKVFKLRIFIPRQSSGLCLEIKKCQKHKMARNGQY